MTTASAIQAVLVELRGPLTVELDTGALVSLSALTLLPTDEQWRFVVGYATQIVCEHGLREVTFYA